MNKKLKILFCTDGIFPHTVGGMQRHSMLLITELAKHPSLELTVVHPHPVNVFNNPAIKEISISSPPSGKPYLVECYRYSKKVYDLAISRPDHIIYSQGLAVWHGIKKIGHRVVINPHGLESYQAIGIRNRLIGLIFKSIFNYLFAHAKYVVSLGGKLTIILKRSIKEQSKVVEIPNATNLPTEDSGSRDFKLPVKVLFLGRFAHNKGIDILFESIKQLESKKFSQQYQFKLGGKGPLFEYYQNNNSYNNVKLLGFVKDEELPDLFKEANLFVLPTLFEGMPTVVLEAMSFKLPVIVSDVGATAELVDDSNGKLVKPGSISGLTAALEWFAGLDEKSRTALGNASIQRVKEKFTWEVTANQYIKLFESCV